MKDNASDSGLELIVDNRKLIVAFALLIIVCGVFFLLGFMEGKRQGAVLAATPGSVGGIAAESLKGAAAAPAGKEEVNSEVARAGKDQLDWYEKVNKPGEPDSRLVEPPVTARVQSSQKSAAGKAADVSPATAYTVQVGAFRKREDAEKRAEMLKTKGYAYTIESPSDPAQSLYHIKVGKFNSRADAVATALRLKRDGFSTFIKTTDK